MSPQDLVDQLIVEHLFYACSRDLQYNTVIQSDFQTIEQKEGHAITERYVGKYLVFDYLRRQLPLNTGLLHSGLPILKPS